LVTEEEPLGIAAAGFYSFSCRSTNKVEPFISGKRKTKIENYYGRDHEIFIFNSKFLTFSVTVW